ncbi:MAG: prepilin peptidase [Candidatus Magasanikbacteria bacterium]|nr:prepilin peptidase [Candidatus Magasanikbacteria bacterium]
MVFYIFIFILGSIIGSFINCLSWRLAHNQKVTLERSECPKCKSKLKWWENFPIFSFLFLKGRCRYCKVKIPIDYLLTELAGGLLFVAVFYFNGAIQTLDTIKILFEFFIVSVLLFIFLHDILYKEILSGAIWLSVVVTLVYQFFKGVYPATGGASIWNILVGGILGFSFFAFQYFISKGKWIGGGDVRLGLLLGLLLGWEKTIVALLFAYWLGALVGLFLIFSKKSKMNSEIPFGTFLVVGTLVALYFGKYIINWYSNIIG